MGMDLYNNDGEYFRFSNHGWQMLLKLAEDNGGLPHCRNIHDNNTHISDIEAREMADVLENSLQTIPDYDVLAGKISPPASGQVYAYSPQGYAIPLDFPSTEIPKRHGIAPIQYFSGIGKEKIKNFIRFCRKGGFDIL